jgi:hypothetical protein
MSPMIDGSHPPSPIQKASFPSVWWAYDAMDKKKKKAQPEQASDAVRSPSSDAEMADPRRRRQRNNEKKRTRDQPKDSDVSKVKQLPPSSTRSAILVSSTVSEPVGIQEISRHLDAILASLPKDAPYEMKAEKLAGLSHEVRQRIAAELAPALNIKAQAMPHHTYDEKKELARWVNDQLRRFDLAIKCPKTGQPSLLLVMTGDHPEIGRFVIEHKTPEGKRVRPVTSTKLPHLELMEAAPRRESLLELRDKAVPKRRGRVSRP